MVWKSFIGLASVFVGIGVVVGVGVVGRSAGEGLGAEAGPREETGQHEQDQAHHDPLGLVPADVRDHRACHQQHQTDGGQDFELSDDMSTRNVRRRVDLTFSGGVSSGW
jgi:hypothetical protein